MARDYMDLGATPCGESCAQVGSENYRSEAMKECARYRDQLESQFPQYASYNCSFGIKAFSHDFGTYHEVVIYFDDEDEESVKFACNVENNLPEYWDNNPLIVRNGEVHINPYCSEV